MFQLSGILLVLGIILITFGVSRYQTIHQLTTKNLKSLDEYSRNLAQEHLVGKTTNATSETNQSFWPELRRLEMRIALAGGNHGGISDLIGSSAVGLILIGLSHYLRQKKRESSPD